MSIRHVGAALGALLLLAPVACDELDKRERTTEEVKKEASETWRKLGDRLERAGERIKEIERDLKNEVADETAPARADAQRQVNDAVASAKRDLDEIRSSYDAIVDDTKRSEAERSIQTRLDTIERQIDDLRVQLDQRNKAAPKQPAQPTQPWPKTQPEQRTEPGKSGPAPATQPGTQPGAPKPVQPSPTVPPERIP